jgi:hypothetical protein
MAKRGPVTATTCCACGDPLLEGNKIGRYCKPCYRAIQHRCQGEVALCVPGKHLGPEDWPENPEGTDYEQHQKQRRALCYHHDVVRGQPIRFIPAGIRLEGDTD